MTGAGSTPFADSSAAPLLADSPGVQRRIDVQRARSGLAGEPRCPSARPTALFASFADSALKFTVPTPCPHLNPTQLLALPTPTAVQELFGLTDDPSVRKRLLSADTNGDGRISRRDVVRVMQSEAAGQWLLQVVAGCARPTLGSHSLLCRSLDNPDLPPPLPLLPPLTAATSRLRHTFTIGAVLLAFCLAMLAANAALTYSVVRMAHETHLHSSGKLTDTTGSLVVGEWPDLCRIAGWRNILQSVVMYGACSDAPAHQPSSHATSRR